VHCATAFRDVHTNLKKKLAILQDEHTKKAHTFPRARYGPHQPLSPRAAVK
jgi:hypothetical protein